MELLEFVKKIELQQSIIDRVILLIDKNKNEYEKYILDLIDYKKAEKTYEMLSKMYKEDTENFHILAIYLLACLKTYELYLKKGIDEKIFIDTMKCFKRFIDECEVKTKKVYFDRPWWTYRQVSMTLFRILQLEFELDYKTKCISIHVPSDAILTIDNVLDSINKAKEFFKKYYGDFKDEYYISSWLLSPKLKKHLKENSNIIKFQNLFELINVDENDNSVLQWVFHINETENYTLLKEDTSLQKSIKKDLINGYKVGSGFAKLKNI